MGSKPTKIVRELTVNKDSWVAYL